MVFFLGVSVMGSGAQTSGNEGVTRERGWPKEDVFSVCKKFALTSKEITCILNVNSSMMRIYRSRPLVQAATGLSPALP